MKKYLALGALLLLAAGPAHSQGTNVAGAGSGAATSVPFSGVTAGTNPNALLVGGSLATSGNGTLGTAGGSLTNFLAQYQGLSPKDYGAKGDTKWCYDGGITATLTTLTSTSCATFTAADVGKIVEIGGAATGPVTYFGTITAFTNATTVTVAPAAGVTVTNAKFLYGHDDTTALQSWVSAINAGSATPTALTVHAGYLPRGFFYTTKPLQFVNPTGIPCCQPNGYGSPEPFTNKNASEGLVIWGDGASNSGIVYATPSNFTWSCGAADTGAFFYGGSTSGEWNWTNLMGFSLVADSTTAYDTTGCSGVIGAFVSDGNAHESVNGIEILGFHNSTGTFPGHVIATTCFESSFSGMQIYNNDVNGEYGVNVTNSGASVMADCHFDKIQWEGWNNSGLPAANVAFYAPDTAGTTISNSTIAGFGSGTEGAGAEIRFTTGFSTPTIGAVGNVAGTGNGEFVISNTAITSQISTNGEVVVVSTGLVRLSLENDRLLAVSASVNSLLIYSGSITSGSNINVFGGSLDCSAACSSGIDNLTGNTIYLYGTANQNGNVGITGTGSGTVFGLFPSATGWTGNGTFSSGAVGQGNGAISLIGNTSGSCTLSIGNTGGVATANCPVNATAVQLSGSAPTITTPGTTPYVAQTALVNDTNNFNKCTFALTTSTLTLALSPVKLCTFTLPNAAVTWFWQCSFSWSNPAGTTPTFSQGVNWAQPPSAASQVGQIWTALAGTNVDGSTATTTNVNFVTTGTLTPAATLFSAFGSGTFTGSATSGTFSPTVSLTGTGATGTAVGGCTIQ